MINHWEDALYKNKKGSIENNYLYDVSKIQTTNRMFDFVDKHIFLNKDSNIMEFGCNVGRNLREAHRRYKCIVSGIDINEECIEKNRAFFGANGFFKQADLRSTACFADLKDKQFDLGITMGFLMHIPCDDNKKELIEEILRVCKSVCFFEMYDPAKKVILGKNEWMVSLEDYCEYNDKIILTDITGKQSSKLRLFVAGNGFQG